MSTVAIFRSVLGLRASLKESTLTMHACYKVDNGVLCDSFCRAHMWMEALSLLDWFGSLDFINFTHMIGNRANTRITILNK